MFLTDPVVVNAGAHQNRNPCRNRRLNRTVAELERGNDEDDDYDKGYDEGRLLCAHQVEQAIADSEREQIVDHIEHDKFTDPAPHLGFGLTKMGQSKILKR